jgi:hypothetical protein
MGWEEAADMASVFSPDRLRHVDTPLVHRGVEPAEVAMAGGAAEALVVPHQQQTQWCWAAVATGVSLYYDPGSTWTQCKVVAAELSRPQCCQDGSTSECNIPWYLDRALRRVARLNDVRDGRPSDADLDAELSQGRPPCLRIGWTGGGGHFVGVGAYDLNNRRLRIEDPWWGSTAVDADEFPDHYQGGGEWTHTYLTR